jgi:hypothetical protein
VQETLSPLEEDLNRIEVGIRQLKTQYDMFFTGHLPRRPFEARKEIETLIEVMGRTAMQRFSDRFRFNSLASKYQTMTELWSKMLRAREEGRLRPGVAGFLEAPRREGSPAVERALSAFRISDPSVEDALCRMFYDKYVHLSRRTGSARRVSYSKFRAQIQSKTEALKRRAGCAAVAYSIEIRQGRPVIKARPDAKGGRRR